MRRLAALVGVALVSLGSRAFADEPTATPPATTPPATTPTPPPPMARPAPAPAGTPAAAEDLPLRLRDLLEAEAARARPQRLFNGIIWTVSSLGLIGAGTISLATASPNDPNAGVVRSYGYIMLAIGGTTFVAAMIGMIPRSSVERLYAAYAPVATEKSYSTKLRLQVGEDALRALAKKDATGRYIAGTIAIVAGVAVAVISVWRGTWTQLAPADRAISGTLTGASAILAIGSGISRIFFDRGTAEVAMEHWQASQGRMRDPVPQARLLPAPFIAPTNGGVMAGVGGSF